MRIRATLGRSLTLWIMFLLLRTITSSEQLCGLQMNSKVVSLRNKVAGYYKHPVECALDSTIPDRGLETDEHGFPQIVINPNTGMNPTTVAHELLHLELSMEGFAPSPPIYAGQAPPGVSVQRLERFETLLSDEIQHGIIFPRLKDLGFSKYASDFSVEIRNEIAQGRAASAAPELEAIYMLRLHHGDQVALLEQDKEFLRSKGMEKEVELGEWLIRANDLRRPSTTQEGIGLLRDGTAKAFDAEWLKDQIKLRTPASRP